MRRDKINYFGCYQKDKAKDLTKYRMIVEKNR